MEVAILGLGSRGRNYGKLIKKGCRISAICDIQAEKVNKLGKEWKVPENKRFFSSDEFFNAGKLCDGLVIATQDSDHYEHAKKAIELGYNILLEKPVSPNLNETLELRDLAKKAGVNIMVCHVLRYSPFYRKIKELVSSGVIGEPVTVKHSENVSYWHFAHSFVRGNWRREDLSSPVILAKCCHDMDLLYWYSGAKANSVSSLGSLKYFKKENAPEGAAERCLDGCEYRSVCPYEAEAQYIGRRKGLFRAKKRFPWGTYAFSTDTSKKAVHSALKTCLYGRCVFKCDNDVCDHQTLNMEMENGVKVDFTVDAFHNENFRHIEIYGTKGEIIADDRGSVIQLKVFGKRPKKIIVNLIPVKGHYGGDQGVIKAFLKMLRTGEISEGLSTIDVTAESHRIAYAAELSRRNSGERIFMKDIRN